MRTKHTVNIGDRFGRLVVTDQTSERKPGRPSRRVVICDCDCGKQVKVLLQALFRTEGGNQSCGCTKQRGSMSERFAATRATTERLHYSTHRLSTHPSYYRWFNMVDRCENPQHAAYANYGGRGITVHEPWRDVTTFLAYLDTELGPCPEGHSLDRIDNDGNYEPGNLRWATRSEQARNRRHR